MSDERPSNGRESWDLGHSPLTSTTHVGATRGLFDNNILSWLGWESNKVCIYFPLNIFKNHRTWFSIRQRSNNQVWTGHWRYFDWMKVFWSEGNGLSNLPRGAKDSIVFQKVIMTFEIHWYEWNSLFLLNMERWISLKYSPPNQTWNRKSLIEGGQ